MPARNSTVSLIANPAAGRAGAVGQAETLARALAHRGWTADLRYTEHPGHAIRLARQAALTHDTVVAIGGGGIMRISPGARMDDGRLNLCLIRAKGWREILRNFPRLLRGTFPGRPGVTYTEGTTLEVLGNVPLPLQVDGSMLGVTPVRCQIRPGALRVAAPAPADG